MPQPTGGDFRGALRRRLGIVLDQLVLAYDAVEGAGTSSFDPQNITDITGHLNDARDAVLASFADIDDLANPS